MAEATGSPDAELHERSRGELRMADRTVAFHFENDPLGFLDRRSASMAPAFEVGPNEYFLRDAVDACAVLRNDDGRYREHSDFFHTRHGLFGPEAARLKIRRESRELVRAHLLEHAARIGEFIDSNLPATSEWPDCGNRLVYRFFLPVLLSAHAPPKLRSLLDMIVERAVLANARMRQARWRRMLLQFRTTLRLSREIEARQSKPRGRPHDLLDVVAGSIDSRQRLDELSEVYLSFVFAIAGSVGFLLGWSLYLLGSHAERSVPSEWIVQEALRLWPVAWQLGRQPSQEHQLAGVTVLPGDEVVVCPYLVHRNESYWAKPHAYEPERWSEPDSWRNPAFIPFGHGRHRCVAADLTPRFVADILDAIRRSNTVSIDAVSGKPIVAAALAPPRFRLQLHERST
ncbi:MAG TPA: cytochrome P450 [Kofleriaceae bacterium]|nr:cytochrome P450 [Kofleriaceae bacterium]